MTTRCQIADCGRPTNEFVCKDCATANDRLLAELDDLAHALDAAYLKAQRFSVERIYATRDDTEQEESPLPFEPAAGRLRRDLSVALLDTTLLVAQVVAPVDALGYPVVLGYGPRAGITPTTRGMALFLREHRSWFRNHPAGPGAIERFASIAAKARMAVDRPADLVFLGICSHPAPEDKPFTLRRNGRVLTFTECPEDLYADATKPQVKCRRCKTTHTVEERRAVLIGALDDQLARAADIARGLSGLGMHVTADRIRQWKARGRIAEHGTALYRVGDVIALVLADQQLKPEKNRTKEATP